MPPDASTPQPAGPDLSAPAVKRRLGWNLLGNLYSQGATLGVQLLAIPLFLYAWGAADYGLWLALAAVPWYFYALADLGFTNLAANDMALCRGAGKTDAAIEVFHNSAVVVLLMGVALAAAGVIAAGQLPVAAWLKTPFAQRAAATGALQILLAQLPLVLIQSLLTAAYRADGKYAHGAAWQGSARLADGLAPAATALLGGGWIAAAWSMLLVKLLAAAAMALAVRRQIPWLPLGVGRMRRQSLQKMLRPAAAFVAIPVAEAMQIQGLTLLVAGSLGPAATTTFNTLRTLGNVAFNAFGIVRTSIWWELSALVGGGQPRRAEALIRRATRLGFLLALAACAILAVAGGPLLRLWTGGKVPMDRGLFYLQLLSILLAAAWRIPATLLLATNRHGRYALLLLAGSATQLALAAWLLARWGLSGAGAAMVFLELFMWAMLARKSPIPGLARMP